MANLVSFTGLLFALTGIILAEKDLILSILFLMAAGICDLFDGFLARKINQNNAIGKQIDSLIDVVSFGVFPAVILISLDGNVIINFLISFIFLSCAVWRLALFNNIPSERNYFTGFPVTFVSLILPIVLIFYFLIKHEISIWIVRLTILILALLFISKVKFKKPKGMFYFIYTGIGVLLSIIWIGIYLKV